MEAATDEGLLSVLFDLEEELDGLASHHFYVSVALALFGCASVWPYYPATGAGFALICLLIALDDAIEHATPYATPLDQVWKHVIYPLLRKFERV